MTAADVTRLGEMGFGEGNELYNIYKGRMYIEYHQMFRSCEKSTQALRPGCCTPVTAEEPLNVFSALWLARALVDRR